MISTSRWVSFAGCLSNILDAVEDESCRELAIVMCCCNVYSDTTHLSSSFVKGHKSIICLNCSR